MTEKKIMWWEQGGKIDRLVVYSFLIFTTAFIPVMAIAGVVAIAKK